MENNPSGSNEDSEDSGSRIEENLQVQLPRSVREIIGEECKGPFEKQLTETEVEKRLLIITESEYDKFILPLLREDDVEDVEKDEIPVIMYANLEDTKASLPMFLKAKDGMYELSGMESWKEFCEGHKSLIEVDAFVKILIFRHARHGNLCSIITRGRLELKSAELSLSMLTKESQDRLRDYLPTIGEWKGPFSKQLTESDMRKAEFLISKEHYKRFIKPLLDTKNVDLKTGVPVTMYDNNNIADEKREVSMILKERLPRRYVLTDGRKDFCQRHESVIKVSDWITLWMFWHKEDDNLCCILTSGRVEEERCILPNIPPVPSLLRLIGNCSEPFVKTPTKTELLKGYLQISKKNWVTYLENLWNTEEKESESLPVTVYDVEGVEFSMHLNKWASKDARALTQGWSAFCQKHNPREDEDLVVWAFRNSEDDKLCFVIIAEVPFTLQSLQYGKR